MACFLAKQTWSKLSIFSWFFARDKLLLPSVSTISTGCHPACDWPVNQSDANTLANTIQQKLADKLSITEYLPVVDKRINLSRGVPSADVSKSVLLCWFARRNGYVITFQQCLATRSVFFAMFSKIEEEGEADKAFHEFAYTYAALPAHFFPNA